MIFQVVFGGFRWFSVNEWFSVILRTATEGTFLPVFSYTASFRLWVRTAKEKLQQVHKKEM